MQKTLPLPYLSPSTAVLARIRQIARQVKPRPMTEACEWTSNSVLA
ncbi:MAG: hypothetical protein HUK03_06225 [Bacteroidaceae bacterium]|nr:hypothetical protein [Bacteroidaceae bacterium]